MLDFKKPVITKNGQEVRIYMCYDYALHGAYFNDDKQQWISASWSVPNGWYSISNSDLDLINV